MDFASYFEDQINVQKRAIRIFKFWIIGLCVAGIMIFIITFLIDDKKEPIAEITKIGGAFIAALSTFPYREIIIRREKIITYQYLKLNFEKTVMKRSKQYSLLLELVIDAMKDTLKR
jgi:hypothetical protein